MALETPWLGIAVAVLAVAAIVVGVLRAATHGRGASGATVVRAERVRALPSVARAARLRVVALVGVLLLALAALGSAAVVASRPMAERVIQPESRSRDIMLCLDVSGSMTDVDAEVIDVFAALTEDFAGERIGLTIFNSSPVQIFPLTDDYAFVREQLQNIRDSFDYIDYVPEHWVGTLNGAGASLVGDGLAACALGFDYPDDERARSIILATDNEVNGAETVPLEAAAAYAGSLGARVFAIDPAPADTAASQELEAASLRSGGAYFGLRDETTVGRIVAEVQSQDATILAGVPRIVRVDAPEPWLLVVGVAGIALVVIAGVGRARI